MRSMPGASRHAAGRRARARAACRQISPPALLPDSRRWQRLSSSPRDGDFGSPRTTVPRRCRRCRIGSPGFPGSPCDRTHRAQGNRRSAHCGIENGLCEKSIFFSSSFHSYIGKSTIQQRSKRSLAIRSTRWRCGVRALAGELVHVSLERHSTKNTASPASKPLGRRSAYLRMNSPGRPTGIHMLRRMAAEIFLQHRGALGPEVFRHRSRRRLPRPRARRCSRGQAGLRPAPRNSCGRRRRGSAAARRRNGPDR